MLYVITVVGLEIEPVENILSLDEARAHKEKLIELDLCH